MPKPPKTPPSSDIGGNEQERLTPAAPEKWDALAQAQLAVENKENVGRPDQDEADQPKPPKGGNPAGGRA